MTNLDKKILLIGLLQKTGVKGKAMFIKPNNGVKQQQMLVGAVVANAELLMF